MVVNNKDIKVFRFVFYWQSIPTEKENAITYEKLMSEWNLSRRAVRRILHELSVIDNGDNYVLIRSSKTKGFYKTDNIREILLYKQECLNRGRRIFQAIKKINRVVYSEDNASQITIQNNLRNVRESLEMTQQFVCDKMKQYDENFDVPMLSKMENGVCLPTPYQRAWLASIYKTTPEFLIDYDF